MALTGKKEQQNQDYRLKALMEEFTELKAQAPLGVWEGKSRSLIDHKQEPEMRGNSKNKANTPECCS